MKIELKNIAPHPLIGAFSLDTDVWGKDVTLFPSTNIHVYAPSGSGKSTLVHILFGDRKDYDGDLVYDNSVVDHSIDVLSSLRENKLSVVFQDLKLLDELTAIENILLKNQLLNSKSIEEIELMAENLGVRKLMDKKVNVLSRGERQRIAILRALCGSFDWIFLDEPFSHLDPDNAKKAANLIQEEATKQNAGIVMANLVEDQWFKYDQKLKMA